MSLELDTSTAYVGFLFNSNKIKELQLKLVLLSFFSLGTNLA
jgi:hypothetical protein